jgi:hypothetical protein
MDGVDNFETLYSTMESNINIDNVMCNRTAGLQLPSKKHIKDIVNISASKLGFNEDCTQNRQQDEPLYSRQFDFYDDESKAHIEKLSPTQRFTVCDLRKKSKTQTEIAKLIFGKKNPKDEEVDSIKDVRCKNIPKPLVA